MDLEGTYVSRGGRARRPYNAMCAMAGFHCRTEAVSGPSAGIDMPRLTMTARCRLEAALPHPDGRLDSLAPCIKRQLWQRAAFGWNCLRLAGIVATFAEQSDLSPVVRDIVPVGLLATWLPLRVWGDNTLYRREKEGA